MTAMTIHLNLPDDLAQKLKELPNLDEYVLGLLHHDLADSPDFEEASDGITDNDLRACEDSYNAYKRGEYVLADDYFAQMRAEREALRKKKEVAA
jgi:hypothetical protein